MALRAPWTGIRWIDLCNRNERLTRDQVTRGRVCRWSDTSELTVHRVFPSVGTRILQRAIAEWPVALAPAAGIGTMDSPTVSIIIPVGGSDRLVPLHLALSAARAQRNIHCEVIVVERSVHPTLRSTLPAGVRYLHQPIPSADSPFNKSAALNAGAEAARGRYLIILDADYIVPVDFAQQCAAALEDCDAVRPARFIFYLDERTTGAGAESRHVVADARLTGIVANNPTPIALRTEAYWKIGGHDERYSGWGGEDSEFLERLRTLRTCEGGWLPVLHAWHAPAAQKESGHRNSELHDRVSAVPVSERIQRLVNIRSAAGGASESDSRLEQVSPSGVVTA